MHNVDVTLIESIKLSVKIVIKNLKYISHLEEKPTMWFQTRSDTNRPVQAPKMAEDGNFWI